MGQVSRWVSMRVAVLGVVGGEISWVTEVGRFPTVRDCLLEEEEKRMRRSVAAEKRRISDCWKRWRARCCSGEMGEGDGGYVQGAEE